jgi:hypothetical protein
MNWIEKRQYWDEIKEDWVKLQEAIKNHGTLYKLSQYLEIPHQDAYRHYHSLRKAAKTPGLKKTDLNESSKGNPHSFQIKRVAQAKMCRYPDRK